MLHEVRTVWQQPVDKEVAGHGQQVLQSDYRAFSKVFVQRDLVWPDFFYGHNSAALYEASLIFFTLFGQ